MLTIEREGTVPFTDSYNEKLSMYVLCARTINVQNKIYYKTISF